MGMTAKCGSPALRVKGLDKVLDGTAKRKPFTPRPANPDANLGWITSHLGVQTVEIVGPVLGGRTRIRPRVFIGRKVVTERAKIVQDYEIYPTVAAAKKAAIKRIKRHLKSWNADLRMVKAFKPGKVA